MVLGLFSDSGMPDAFFEKAGRRDRKGSLPLLSEMTGAALRVLEKNKNGFFLMIEAGQIDWACHENDAGWLLREMIRLDETVKTVRKWAAEREDTLVIITADHETGGPGFSYSRCGKPMEIPLHGNLFGDRRYRAKFNFGDPSLLDRIYRQKLSYGALFGRFDSLPAGEKSPESLERIINSNTRFPVKAEDAKRILGGSTGKRKRGIYDFSDFYVYPGGERSCILARIVAKEQNLVWSSGALGCGSIPLYRRKPVRGLDASAVSFRAALPAL